MATTATARGDTTPSPAVAPPPGNPRFALFDSLRAIAALAILVFHVAAITAAIEDPVTGDVLAVLGSRGVVLPRSSRIRADKRVNICCG